MIGIVQYPLGSTAPFEFLNSDHQFVAGAVDTYTFEDVDFGDERGGRTLIASIVWLALSAGRTLTSATIGGVTCTIVDQASKATGDSSISVGTAIVMAVVPAGTSGDIEIVLSSALGSTDILYGLYSKGSAVVHQHDHSTADSPTATLDIPAGGFAIGAATAFGMTALTWTGLAQDYVIFTTLAGASHQATTAESATVLKANYTVANPFRIASGTFATFR